MNKLVHIIGGGTVSHVRNHLAICAPAYGTTAKRITKLCSDYPFNDVTPIPYNFGIKLHLTKMAGGETLETFEDIEILIDQLVDNPQTKIIILNAAIVDFSGMIDNVVPSKYAPRLKSRDDNYLIELQLYPKLAKRIRRTRKDIFLVTFKASFGLTESEQYKTALNSLKESSSNLVLANDTKTRLNMIVTPEEAAYNVTTDRESVLRGLVEIMYYRSQLTFTRSTIVNGDPVLWTSSLVPDSLRTIVNYCIHRGAYKRFRGVTAGHFAVKLDDKTFLTSRRKTDFNNLANIGLVRVVANGLDEVIAYGSKPSVGGQSQRILFADHPEYDCIVHFHCVLKNRSHVPQVSQREFECGSHECGKNTSNGLKNFGNLSAVYLDNHGPNIVFNHSTNPNEIIKFIEENFDLDTKSGGYQIGIE